MRQLQVDVWQDRQICPENRSCIKTGTSENYCSSIGYFQLIFNRLVIVDKTRSGVIESVIRIFSVKLPDIRYLLVRSYHITAGYRSNDK